MASLDPAAAAAEAQAIADRLASEGGHLEGGDFSNKRKLDDHDHHSEAADGPTRKRLSVTGPDSDGVDGMGLANGAGEYKEVINCPKNLVGKLIGREGATIKDLQSRSKTQIQIDHDSIGDSKKVTLSGTRDAVELVKSLIKDVLETDSSSQPGESARSVDCPAGIVGRIIGRGGETIRSLQSASGAHIVVDQNFPDGVPRKVNVSGRSDAVERAVKMVTELIQGEPGSAQQIIQKYGAGDVRYVDCPKAMVGRVIGKGGETIKTLQKNTGASIQIDQNCEPTKITITGKRAAVEQAIGMVKAIIANEDLNVVLGGSGGGGGPQGFGGGPRPAGFGPGPGFGPSGGFPPAGAPYGAPMGGAPYAGYGSFPMQQGAPPAPYPGYGGYGMYGSQYPPAAGAPQQYPSYGNYGSNPAPAAADPYSQNNYAAGYNQPAGGAAARPAPAAASSVWQEFHDSEGRPFYYNSQTGASQWEKPADFQA